MTRTSKFSYSAIVSLAAILTSCGPVQNAQRAAQRDAVEAKANHCRDRRSAGEFKTYAESAACVNAVYSQGVAAGIYRYPDLVFAYMAPRLRIAEQEDRGEITEAQAQAQWAQVRARVLAIAQERDAQRNRDNIAAIGTYAGIMAAGMEMARPAPSTSVTCSTFGTMTNCTER